MIMTTKSGNIRPLLTQYNLSRWWEDIVKSSVFVYYVRCRDVNYTAHTP